MENVKSMGGAKVVIYPGPPEIQPVTDRIVTVDEMPLFLYDTAVNFNRSWYKNPTLEKTPIGYFDFSGTVVIKVSAPGLDIRKAIVRPLSLGIVPKIVGDTISFEIDKPGKLTIEINDDIHRATHLFANSLEVNPPKEGAPGVIYFAPGIHNVGEIPVKNDETVYIAGGAVVYGYIKCIHRKNVKIMGRGIIDGSIYDRWKDTFVPINLIHCSNCSIDGIILLDPSAWTLNTYFCDNITISDVKIISARENGDGITTQSCTNITATDCFVRSWDDNLVVKGYDGDTRGIIFENMILWTDLAQSCEVGYETRANTIEDITFKNITVLHNFHKPVISIHNSDNALVRNVHFTNVVVEDAEMGLGDGVNFLIDLAIRESQWTRSKNRGNIRDVYIENIIVLDGKFPPSCIEGFSEAHTVENVYIDNLMIFDRNITDMGQGGFQINEYSKNIKLEPSRKKTDASK